MSQGSRNDWPVLQGSEQLKLPPLEEYKHWLVVQRLVDVIAIAASDENWNQAGDDAEPTAAAGDLGAGASTRRAKGVGTPGAKGRGRGRGDKGNQKEL